jgi:hypothetical protein
LKNAVEVGGAGSDGFEPPKYLSSLIAAINDGAKAAQAGGLAFALVGVYLLATAFSASDEDLLRSRAVTISQIGASLPVSFSFAIAPFVFVFLHIYTLARYDMLAANVRQFLSELRRTVIFGTDQERCRQLLANVEFVQVLVAPRGWVWRWLVRVLIAIFPVLVLLLVQINALRYQSASILWAQRAWLQIDLLALVLFFYRNPLNGPEVWSNTRPARLQQWMTFGQPGEPRQPERTIEISRRPLRRLVVPVSLFLFIVGIDLIYINIVPTGADPKIVRYDLLDPMEAKQHYTIVNFLSNPLDLIACKHLQWGCRYLHVRKRTLVDHVLGRQSHN